MIVKNLWITAACTILIAGCSSQQTVVETPPQQQPPVVAPPQVSDLSYESGTVEGNEVDETILSDSLMSVMLEKARQHYLSATAAMENRDSVRSAGQFEEAIKILDELSYVPDIEGNKDFNDLSKAVIEDYEQYIAHIDSLSPQSSIFALREKMSQMADIGDSLGAGPTKEIVTGTTIPLVVNRLVEQNIAFLQGRGRVHMERWLVNAGKYFPTIRRIFHEESVPEELAFISMIESGLNPAARSWARAVGMWQFMKGTGSLYGLSGNYWYDERRDFEKATRAAARHMKDLHDQFGDWYLVFAAYNAGPGWVHRGVRRTGSTDFWVMRRALPRQTRNYIPQYIATAIIGLHPKDYGFGDVVPAPPLNFENVTIGECVDLEILARCAGTDVETMRDLNPELVQWCTPPGMKKYVLRIPAGTLETFKQNYASVPDEQKRDWIVHTVRKGETLAAISAKYGIPVTAIQDANKLGSSKRLSIGKPIAIPVPRGSERYAALVASSARVAEATGRVRGVRGGRRAIARFRMAKVLAHASKQVPADASDHAKISYSVKKGDTIGHIAEWYGCRAADIRNWNDIPYGRPIHAGENLTVWVDKVDAAAMQKIEGMSFAEKEQLSKQHRSAEKAEEATADAAPTYLVKKGDTLEKIAQSHGVTIKQLQLWNDLRTSRIHAGQELVIRTGTVKVKAIAAAVPAEKGRASDRVLIYKVKKGDTLWEIARAHSVEAAELKTWNDIRKNRIVAGQELVIHIAGIAANLKE